MSGEDKGVSLVTAKKKDDDEEEKKGKGRDLGVIPLSSKTLISLSTDRSGLLFVHFGDGQVCTIFFRSGRVLVEGGVMERDVVTEERTVEERHNEGRCRDRGRG